MSRVGHRFFAAGVWAMIPFLIASGIPRVGCVCANGDHRPFCMGYRQDGPSPSNSCSACSGCECCPATTAHHPTQGQSDQNCCARSDLSASPGVTQSGRCCQPYLIVPSVVKDDVAVSPPLADYELVWQPLSTKSLSIVAETEGNSSLSLTPISSGVDILQRGCVLVI
ncbi:MAG: hypothetical protein HZA46_07095 [Planctomycetales bacterium]|nr:hypothetical protein [Planctomycetales bacterium]